MHGTQGCPKIISFDKNHWHFNFWRTFSIFFFLCCYTPIHFSQRPLPKKCTPFFLQVINPWILFLLSFSLQFFHPSLKNVPIIHIEGFWNLPVNPVRRVPGFMEEKADNEHSNPLFYGPSPLNSQHLHFQFTISSLLKIFARSRREWEKKCREGSRQCITMKTITWLLVHQITCIINLGCGTTEFLVNVLGATYK